MIHPTSFKRIKTTTYQVKFISFYRLICSLLLVCFFTNTVVPPQFVNAQMAVQPLLGLPLPGQMVPTSPGFIPAFIKGLTIHPENPLHFDFIIDTGDSKLAGEKLSEEASRLIKYFLASLTVPENELWVNLSPYEKDRIVSNGLSQTEMGRDMLAQDYLLKQLTASLMYPEEQLGEEFWHQVQEKAQKLYGTSNIPTNTFNKVWVVPDKAVVYEHENSAFVVTSHLKVMLEEEYLAMQNNVGANGRSPLPDVSTEIIREVLIPEIEKEVNQGKNFANLRQIYNSMILAMWYKRTLKESLLGQVYFNQNKTSGIDVEDKQIKEKIYQQYLKAFQKGVYDYIKDDYDPATQEVTPRKYFSGGLAIDPNKIQILKSEDLGDQAMLVVSNIVKHSSPDSEFLKADVNLVDVGEHSDEEAVHNVAREAVLAAAKNKSTPAAAPAIEQPPLDAAMLAVNKLKKGLLLALITGIATESIPQAAYSDKFYIEESPDTMGSPEFFIETEHGDTLRDIIFSKARMYGVDIKNMKDPEKSVDLEKLLTAVLSENPSLKAKLEEKLQKGTRLNATRLQRYLQVINTLNKSSIYAQETVNVNGQPVEVYFVNSADERTKWSLALNYQESIFIFADVIAQTVERQKGRLKPDENNTIQLRNPNPGFLAKVWEGKKERFSFEARTRESLYHELIHSATTPLIDSGKYRDKHAELLNVVDLGKYLKYRILQETAAILAEIVKGDNPRYLLNLQTRFGIASLEQTHYDFGYYIKTGQVITKRMLDRLGYKDFLLRRVPSTPEFAAAAEKVEQSYAAGFYFLPEQYDLMEEFELSLDDNAVRTAAREVYEEYFGKFPEFEIAIPSEVLQVYREKYQRTQEVQTASPDAAMLAVNKLKRGLLVTLISSLVAESMPQAASSARFHTEYPMVSSRQFFAKTEPGDTLRSIILQEAKKLKIAIDEENIEQLMATVLTTNPNLADQINEQLPVGIDVNMTKVTHSLSVIDTLNKSSIHAKQTFTVGGKTVDVYFVDSENEDTSWANAVIYEDTVFLFANVFAREVQRIKGSYNDIFGDMSDEDIFKAYVQDRTRHELVHSITTPAINSGQYRDRHEKLLEGIELPPDFEKYAIWEETSASLAEIAGSSYPQFHLRSLMNYAADTDSPLSQYVYTGRVIKERMAEKLGTNVENLMKSSQDREGLNNAIRNAARELYEEYFGELPQFTIVVPEEVLQAYRAKYAPNVAIAPDAAMLAEVKKGLLVGFLATIFGAPIAEQAKSAEYRFDEARATFLAKIDKDDTIAKMIKEIAQEEGASIDNVTMQDLISKLLQDNPAIVDPNDPNATSAGNDIDVEATWQRLSAISYLQRSNVVASFTVNMPHHPQEVYFVAGGGERLLGDFNAINLPKANRIFINLDAFLIDVEHQIKYLNSYSPEDGPNQFPLVQKSMNDKWGPKEFFVEAIMGFIRHELSHAETSPIIRSSTEQSRREKARLGFKLDSFGLSAYDQMRMEEEISAYLIEIATSEKPKVHAGNILLFTVYDPDNTPGGPIYAHGARIIQRQLLNRLGYYDYVLPRVRGEWGIEITDTKTGEKKKGNEIPEELVRTLYDETDSFFAFEDMAKFLADVPDEQIRRAASDILKEYYPPVSIPAIQVPPALLDYFQKNYKSPDAAMLGLKKQNQVADRAMLVKTLEQQHSKVFDYFQELTGENNFQIIKITKADATKFQNPYPQIVDPIKRGEGVILDLSDLANEKDRLNYAMNLFRELEFLLGSVIRSRLNFQHDHPGFPVLELLKNALVHGNKLDFTQPIFLYIDPKVKENVLGVHVLDVASDKEADPEEMKLAEDIALHGAHKAIDIYLKPENGFDYSREEIKTQGVPVGSHAIGYLRPKKKADENDRAMLAQDPVVEEMAGLWQALVNNKEQSMREALYKLRSTAEKVSVHEISLRDVRMYEYFSHRKDALKVPNRILSQLARRILESTRQIEGENSEIIYALENALQHVNFADGERALLLLVKVNGELYTAVMDSGKGIEDIPYAMSDHNPNYSGIGQGLELSMDTTMDRPVILASRDQIFTSKDTPLSVQEKERLAWSTPQQGTLWLSKILAIPIRPQKGSETILSESRADEAMLVSNIFKAGDAKVAGVKDKALQEFARSIILTRKNVTRYIDGPDEESAESHHVWLRDALGGADSVFDSDNLRDGTVPGSSKQEKFLTMMNIVALQSPRIRPYLDMRLVKSMLLPVPIIGHDIAVKREVNPNSESLVGIYGAAGVDASNFFLSTNATEGYFIGWNYAQKRASVPITSVGGNMEKLYKSKKFTSGYSASDGESLTYLSYFDALIVELEAMGISKEDIEKIKLTKDIFGKDPVTTIHFEWAYPNEKPKIRTIHFINGDIRKINSLNGYLPQRVDFYLQRAGLSLPPKFGQYLPAVNRYIKEGGFHILDTVGAYRSFGETGDVVQILADESEVVEKKNAAMDYWFGLMPPDYKRQLNRIAHAYGRQLHVYQKVRDRSNTGSKIDEAMLGQAKLITFEKNGVQHKVVLDNLQYYGKGTVAELRYDDKGQIKHKVVVESDPVGGQIKGVTRLIAMDSTGKDTTMRSFPGDQVAKIITEEKIYPMLKKLANEDWVKAQLKSPEPTATMLIDHAYDYTDLTTTELSKKPLVKAVRNIVGFAFDVTSNRDMDNLLRIVQSLEAKDQETIKVSSQLPVASNQELPEKGNRKQTGTQEKKNVGGIDFNPALLDMQIKRDGNGVPLPLPQQPIQNMHINGFLPIIINITPVTNLPLLLGAGENPEPNKELSLAR